MLQTCCRVRAMQAGAARPGWSRWSGGVRRRRLVAPLALELSAPTTGWQPQAACIRPGTSRAELTTGPTILQPPQITGHAAS